ncbi:hypothetical protein ATE84_0064 [Aquimarina sp. MAR_2010_214]|uniref:hypothetical protein n=1 Tax=Aquimarina sp. MAR_2010_214 TaxID=1250026 RepID=UPI000C702B3E|nr:hypothetical protein [Aquimarina sp. MAR_2010_214]PKV48078.1 hypothetical protein ATE84_0064 [Aquimarina sp. MAR_2010_214]
MKTSKNNHLKKVIVDFKKLTNTILDLLVIKYPDGYDDKDIITFRNAQNEIVECVEVKTEDTLYLVKVSKHIVTAMEDHDDNDEDNQDKESEFEEFEEETDEPSLEE